MHLGGIGAADEVRVVPIAAQQRHQLVVGNARQQRRIGDLVLVEVEDREHDPVACRVEELVAVPTRGERTGLRLTVTDDAHDDEIRMVEGGAVGVQERVAELTALVERARCLRRAVAGHAAGR